MKRERRSGGKTTASSCTGYLPQDTLERCLQDGSAALRRSAEALKKIDALLELHQETAPPEDDAAP